MTAWDDLAAAGTDPNLLVDVVGALIADESGTRRRVADLLDQGADPGAALRRAVGTPPLVDVGAGEVRDRWRRHGVRVVLLGDPVWPDRLTTVADPPPLLAMRGAMPDAERPTVAIVGARASTPYGRGVAAWLAEAAADAGVHVVSGGAVGIDAAAHGAAAELPGRTTVVLGCGHAINYPRPHASAGGLFDRVVDGGGGLMSEFLPMTRPQAHRVRGRNRLVAGLADVVVVVEGGARSGSLVTANAAADRGVTVLAVPGDVRAPGSAAPHRLLSEGAMPCTRPADLLDALGLMATGPPTDPSTGRARTTPSVLPGEVRDALATAWPRPVAVQDLAQQAHIDTGQLLAALTRARVAGEVAQTASGVVLRRPPVG
jgi:DNA processing protein